MAVFQDVPSSFFIQRLIRCYEKRKKEKKKNLADVCGDGSGPIEGNNFEEDESISK